MNCSLAEIFSSYIEMFNCLLFLKSIIKYITKDFNSAQLHYQLKQFVKKQLLFNYQLHYQSIKTKAHMYGIFIENFEI